MCHLKFINFYNSLDSLIEFILNIYNTCKLSISNFIYNLKIKIIGVLYTRASTYRVVWSAKYKV